MKALIQRVKNASVAIDGKIFSKINSGILFFLGVEKADTKENAQKLADKILKLRIFEDNAEKMNLSIQDIKGEILIVSQFTLCGNCAKGTRPSFDNAAKPEIAKDLYEYFVNLVEQSGLNVQTGKFQAMMHISLINDGPVTFWVEK
ncbi:D-tyrosyl-tRNA(Tyr) deacylase [bacterium]|nr:D-tyrosyl-tRNA(Tyr) deacylase [bacterium]